MALCCLAPLLLVGYRDPSTARVVRFAPTRSAQDDTYWKREFQAILEGPARPPMIESGFVGRLKELRNRIGHVRSEGEQVPSLAVAFAPASVGMTNFRGGWGVPSALPKSSLGHCLPPIETTMGGAASTVVLSSAQVKAGPGPHSLLLSCKL
jgi:hypothetical protein